LSAFELVEPADRGVCRRWPGGSLVGEVGGDVGEVAPECGIGQSESTGQGQDGRGFAGDLSQFCDGQLDVFDAGQAGAAGYARVPQM
jgi:hypothetical protein